MVRTHWWMLSALLSLALIGAAVASPPDGSCPACPRSPCGACPVANPACESSANAEDEDSPKDDEDAAAPAKTKCACEQCKCETCKGKDCTCGKDDDGKCKCGCAKCPCAKTAAKGCCANGCCSKGCCAKAARKTCADTKEANKPVPTGESEYVHIVLEDLTVNYFGAGVNIKRIKVRYKGQGLEASDLAKDISSIGRAPASCGPVPCYVVPGPVAAPVRVAH